MAQSYDMEDRTRTTHNASEIKMLPEQAIATPIKLDLDTEDKTTSIFGRRTCDTDRKLPARSKCVLRKRGSGLDVARKIGRRDVTACSAKFCFDIFQRLCIKSGRAKSKDLR